MDFAKASIPELPKIPYASEVTLKRAHLQAKSLLENQIIQLSNPENIPDAPLKLYFDIEGDPFLGLDYLFGFWVSGDKEHRYAQIGNARLYEEKERYLLYFLAEQVDQEENMWHAFLKWIEILPEDFKVYHYANYEKHHLKTLSERYGTSDSLQKFLNNLIDLQRVVEKSLIFPLYFYSINLENAVENDL